MIYDKGKQITVGELKGYLSLIPDDVKIFVGIGANVAPLRCLLNHRGELLLHPVSYMVDADTANLKTILSFNTK